MVLFMYKIKKIVSVIIRTIIKKLNYINPTIYMKVYNKYLRKCGVNIKKYKGIGYIDPTVDIDGTDYSLISIGDNVTISKHVLFLTHDFSIWTALVSKNKDLNKKRIRFLKPIEIGNNVFIGAYAIILPGSVIEDNVIIGSNTIVKGHYYKNSVYAGNPSRKISTLDEFIKKHKEKKDYEVIK